MSELKLLSTYSLADLPLSNRVVMAPMTRTRASGPGDIPTALMALYYAQRASAGLIIAEATHVSSNAVGYVNAPGIFTAEQVEGWRMITSAVHHAGGKIFLQLFHTGRLSHPYFKENGAAPWAPSATPAKNCVAYITGYFGKPVAIPFGEPQPMTGEQINQVINEFASAAGNAINAGFDGVEIHAANGYLLEQFMNPYVNTRTDDYGSSVANRIKLTLDVVDAVSAAIGEKRVGVRISPFGKLHDMPEYSQAEETYLTLTDHLNQRNIAYLHIFDQSAFGTGALPENFLADIRAVFKNTIMLNGGFDKFRAESSIREGLADLIAFGRPFIANPDLVQRFIEDLPLATSDNSRWYGVSGIGGYADYPFYNEKHLVNL